MVVLTPARLKQSFKANRMPAKGRVSDLVAYRRLGTATALCMPSAAIASRTEKLDLISNLRDFRIGFDTL